MTRPPKPRPRGVSLVEALVAVAAMGIGMLGIVGLQGTLRGNSDIARQRSEAVRFAQEAIERWRALTAMDTVAGRLAYADLVTASAESIPGTNASYERTRTIVPMDTRTGVAERDTAPRAKSLRVTVSWVDRNDDSQSVTLATAIAGVMPELAASLAVPADGDPVRKPFDRHRRIPLPAKWLDEEYSAIKPPGAAADVAWRFDNETAWITLCTTTAATTAAITPGNLSCGSERAFLLSGSVRYATELAQPTNVEPASDPLVLEVRVDRTAPSPLQQPCYVQNVTAPSKYTAYLCAVPVVPQTPPTPTSWSGRAYFKPDVLFPDAGGEYKVCRYFGDGGFATGGTYTNVTEPVVNQNYLVIRAAYVCPDPPTVAAPHQEASYPGP